MNQEGKPKRSQWKDAGRVGLFACFVACPNQSPRTAAWIFLSTVLGDLLALLSVYLVFHSINRMKSDDGFIAATITVA